MFFFLLIDTRKALLAYFGTLGIAGLLDLVRPLLCEPNAEHSEQVTVCGPDIDVGLDQRLPFLHHRPQLVGGQVHAVEVGQDVAALDLLSDQFELAECDLVILEIGERDLEDPALQTVRGNFCERKGLQVMVSSDAISNIIRFKYQPVGLTSPNYSISIY